MDQPHATGNGPLEQFGRVWDAGFGRLESAYARLLHFTLPRRWLVIAVGLASFGAGLSLMVFGFIGLDFFPNGDQSELDLTLTMPPATTLDATNAVAQQIESELRSYPEVRSLFSVVGQSSVGSGNGAVGGGSNQAQITALLVGRTERLHSSADLAENVYHPSLTGTRPRICEQGCERSTVTRLRSRRFLRSTLAHSSSSRSASHRCRPHQPHSRHTT